MSDDISYDAASEALNQLARLEIPEQASPVPPGQRPCPICGEHMQTDTFEGVGIDVCEQHGIWLDNGELPAIASRIRSRGRRSKHTAVRQAKRDGKVSGVLFGVWSLLWSD